MQTERLFLNKTEVAVKLGISIPTVNRRIADKTIPSKKIGNRVLIPVAWLEELQAVE